MTQIAKRQPRKNKKNEQHPEVNQSLESLLSLIKQKFDNDSAGFEKLALDDQLKTGSNFVKLIELIQKTITCDISQNSNTTNMEINKIAEIIRNDEKALSLVNSLLDRLGEINEAME